VGCRRRLRAAADAPRVSVEQAAHFGEALVKGTPRRGRLALTVLSDTVRGVT
jgi:hypothetical protein